MYLIILLGLVLRLSYIVKPEGLWNDEYVSWMVSSTPFFEGFFRKIAEQCHMPLYYFYLKPFVNCSDTILRMTSLIPGVISIWTMYLAGKEYSKKAGMYACFITSVLSFLIYYSQEVRFYSLLFLFASISLLFTIRLIKQQSKRNFTGWIISLILILFTHVLGIIYVFFNVFYVLYKKKIMNSKILLATGVTCIVLLPFGINILRMLPSSQWWGFFSYTNILFLFSDFYSPILTNNVNAPPVFFYDKTIAAWLVIPTVIGIIGLLKGIRKNTGFFLICAGTVFVMSILALNHIIVFITKYAIEILPIVIFLTAIGFVRLKKAGVLLLSLFVSVHILAFFTPNYVTKIPRNEGHGLVGTILNNRNADNILFTYYEPDRFSRYVDLKDKKTYFISKSNRFEYQNQPQRILENIKPGESVSVVFLESVSFFDDEQIKMFAKKAPEMFLTFSKIRNGIQKELNDNYTGYKVDTLGSWLVITATKK